MSEQISTAFALGAPVVFPCRSRGAFATLRSLSEAAHLPLEYLDVGRGPLPAVEPLRMLRGAGEAPPAHWPFTSERLRTALADPEVTWLALGARPAGGEDWYLRVPLVPGPLLGAFRFEALDPLTHPALQLFGHLFDMHLVDWGRVAPTSPRTWPALEEPVSPPEVGTVSYFSVDLASAPELSDTHALPRLQRVRTQTGGLLMAPQEWEDLPALQPLQACCVPLFAPWRPPPVELLPGTESAPLHLRDTSAGLAKHLAHLARTAAKQVLAMGAKSVPLTLSGLFELESFLLPVARHLPPRMLECWSAFAGEVLVASGGRWRRVLDPEMPYPDNLLVQVGTRVFWPYPTLRALLEGKSALPLATALMDLGLE